MAHDMLVHPETEKQVARFIDRPAHAILIEGPGHIGKHLLARDMAAQLLGITLETLAHNAGYFELSDQDAVIPVDQTRELGHFFSLKALGSQRIKRVACIPDAERMNTAAQNALLKTLEEPPTDAVLILTSSHPDALLPTIRSRVQHIMAVKPSAEAVYEKYAPTHSEADIKRALLRSDGKIGLVHRVLTQGESTAFDDVRDVLKLGLYPQLLLVNTTLKDKEAARSFVESLSQIAAASLLNTADNPQAAAQWRRISSAAYTAGAALGKNANPKLVLTELMLSLRG